MKTNRLTQRHPLSAERIHKVIARRTSISLVLRQLKRVGLCVKVHLRALSASYRPS